MTALAAAGVLNAALLGLAPWPRPTAPTPTAPRRTPMAATTSRRTTPTTGQVAIVTTTASPAKANKTHINGNERQIRR